MLVSPGGRLCGLGTAPFLILSPPLAQNLDGRRGEPLLGRGYFSLKLLEPGSQAGALLALLLDLASRFFGRVRSPPFAVGYVARLGEEVLASRLLVAELLDQLSEFPAFVVGRPERRLCRLSRFRKGQGVSVPLLLELRDAGSQRGELSLGFRVLVANRVAVTANLVQNDRERLDRASLFLAGATGLGRLRP